MTAPELSPTEAAIVARFDAAFSAPEAWRPEHSADCTEELRGQGMYAIDCERCDRWVGDQYRRFHALALLWGKP